MLKMAQSQTQQGKMLLHIATLKALWPDYNADFSLFCFMFPFSRVVYQCYYIAFNHLSKSKKGRN